jgi:hypothetical protein
MTPAALFNDGRTVDIATLPKSLSQWTANQSNGDSMRPHGGKVEVPASAGDLCRLVPNQDFIQSS